MRAVSRPLKIRRLPTSTFIGLPNIRARSFIQPARSRVTVRSPERRTPEKAGAYSAW
jgi:hypothetical protein